MRFDVITLFPELFAPFQKVGVVRRAFEQAQVQCLPWQLRDFAEGAYRRVDDRPYGGGPGMVMTYPPLAAALAAIRAAHSQERVSPVTSQAPVILFSPAGKPMRQEDVQHIADGGQGAILVCGRYEGIDQRFIDQHVDQEFSIGDYVLSGGELPAMALIDAVCRLLPDVLGDAQSHQQDSHSNGLLDCPHFSRPETITTALGIELNVPEVLTAGNHAQIAQWRREASLRITSRRRPELIREARERGRLSVKDEAFLRQLDEAGDQA